MQKVWNSNWSLGNFNKVLPGSTLEVLTKIHFNYYPRNGKKKQKFMIDLNFWCSVIQQDLNYVFCGFSNFVQIWLKLKISHAVLLFWDPYGLSFLKSVRLRHLKGIWFKVPLWTVSHCLFTRVNHRKKGHFLVLPSSIAWNS